MDKGLLIGLIISSGAFILFLIKDDKRFQEFYKCEIKTFKGYLVLNDLSKKPINPIRCFCFYSRNFLYFTVKG